MKTNSYTQYLGPVDLADNSSIVSFPNKSDITRFVASELSSALIVFSSKGFPLLLHIPQLSSIFEVDFQSVSPSKLPKSEIVSTVEDFLNPANLVEDRLFANLDDFDHSFSSISLITFSRSVNFKVKEKVILEPKGIDVEDFLLDEDHID